MAWAGQAWGGRCGWGGGIGIGIGADRLGEGGDWDGGVPGKRQPSHIGGTEGPQRISKKWLGDQQNQTTQRTLGVTCDAACPFILMVVANTPVALWCPCYCTPCNIVQRSNTKKNRDSKTATTLLVVEPRGCFW